MKCMLIRKSFMYPMMPISTEHSCFLYTIRALKENIHYSVAIISIGTGILIHYFKSMLLFIAYRKTTNGNQGRIINKELLSQDYTIAICSTVISDIVALLAKHHIKVISLIHELPHLIQQKLLSNENKHHLKIQQIINDKTSGSVFKQWIKGVSASIRTNDR